MIIRAPYNNTFLSIFLEVLSYGAYIIILWYNKILLETTGIIFILYIILIRNFPYLQSAICTSQSVCALCVCLMFAWLSHRHDLTITDTVIKSRNILGSFKPVEEFYTIPEGSLFYLLCITKLFFSFPVTWDF